MSDRLYAQMMRSVANRTALTSPRPLFPEYLRPSHTPDRDPSPTHKVGNGDRVMPKPLSQVSLPQHTAFLGGITDVTR